MANMSYCRFQNTLSDLLDCQEALRFGDVDDLDSYEKSAMIELIEVCKQIAEIDVEQFEEL